MGGIAYNHKYVPVAVAAKQIYRSVSTLYGWKAGRSSKEVQKLFRRAGKSLYFDLEGYYELLAAEN